MNYLIVVAHPDDEVLGVGASIHKWASAGNKVDICIMCSEVKARTLRPDDNELINDMSKSKGLLGIRNIYKGVFPNIEMNNSSHIQLVQFIEDAIIESQPDIVITHHFADTNNDHLHTSLACQEAIRLFQRRPEIRPIQELWYMETASSTDWSVNSAVNRFTPNTYVEVGKEGIDIKIEALKMYLGVMRPYPHPRSEESIKGLAVYRGSQSGCDYAEAFECVFRRITK